jgi:general secretion pathway protein C
VITIRPHQIAASILLASLGTSAFFFAQGTTSLLASKLFATDPAAGPVGGAGGARVAVVPPRRNVDPRRIIDRNIFAPPAPVVADAGVVVDLQAQPGALTPCPAEMRVLGAVINPAVPAWSYAALAQGQTQSLLYRPGSQFAGKTVESIESGRDPDNERRAIVRVIFRESNGAGCFAMMFPTAPPPQAAAAPAVVPTAPTAVAPGTPAQPPGTVVAGDITAGDLDQGITRISDTQYTVQQSVMQRALAQQDTLFRSARLIPNEENGAVSGMKVYGIRRSSVLGRLGLQNGDVLANVNGQPMASADGLMQAYSLLGRSGSFNIAVVRRGQPMTITYDVQ